MKRRFSTRFGSSQSEEEGKTTGGKKIKQTPRPSLDKVEGDGERGGRSCGQSRRCRGAVNYLGALYFFARLLSVSFIPLLPSPFKISHREPSHSSSSVHRSLARSTLADWSSSKWREGGTQGPFDPPPTLHPPPSQLLSASLVKEKTAAESGICL